MTYPTHQLPAYFMRIVQKVTGNNCQHNQWITSLCAQHVITFPASRRRQEMYCGHVRLCVCPRLQAHTIAQNRM